MELSLLDEVHEPFKREDSGDKGDGHPDEKLRGERAALCAPLEHFGLFCRIDRLALEPFNEIEKRRAADRRDAHEEGKFARVLAVRSHEEHRGNCGAAAADARDAGKALDDSRDERAPPVHRLAGFFRMVRAGPSPFRSEEERSREEKRAADESRTFEKRFDLVLEAKPDGGCRNRREDDVARFPELRLVAERAALDDVPDFFPEDDEDGKERPRMEHDVEEHARVL